MKESVKLLNLGITVILTIGIPTIVGIKFNQPLVGILFGGISAIAYLINYVIKKK